jgi:hypothetical protein
MILVGSIFLDQQKNVGRSIRNLNQVFCAILEHNSEVIGVS